MENNPTQYPVLVACHDLGKLREEILRHFQNHRVNADLRPFASLPSAEETAEKYLAVLYLPELSVKTQTERAVRLGKQAGLPCFSVTRQSAGWGKALSTFMPPEDSTPRPQMLEFLRVVGDGKPWGWHRLVLSLHPAFQGDGAVPPAVQCREDLLAYIQRLPPDKLPESMRPKRNGIDAPSPPKPAPSVSVVSAEEEVVRLELLALQGTHKELQAEHARLQEEYGFLKAEYDRMCEEVNPLRALVEVQATALRESEGLEQNLQKQIAELSKEIGRRENFVDPATLPNLVKKWEETGRVAAEKVFAPKVKELQGQVSALQTDLQSADMTITAQEEHAAKALDQISFLTKEVETLRAKGPPKGLRPAATQPTITATALKGLEDAVAGGALSHQEAFESLLRKLRA